ncbi:hypothetical protein L1987_10387 [Smallanthus sonchifolius]|uniref:Uncharacterized protein n=1 Tax=Smallanthus sonchifolius TaxID=185202 RepID=A0ACB9JRY1_9ASTR|nr:hypothetical protein L1987_10387 [Smallanthus sonchifolius]
MQSLAPSSKINIKSIMRKPSSLPDHNRLVFTIQSAARRFDSAPNAANPAVSVAVPSTNNFASGGVGRNRTDWQSSCAILASNVVQKTEKTTGTDNITVVNDQKTLDLIESRPNRNRPVRVVDDANAGTAKHFEYMFYVDFEASMADVRAQNALSEVEEYTSFLRVLGSYPMDMMTP